MSDTQPSPYPVTYERDFYGRARPVVDHSADPLVPPTPAVPQPTRSWLARLIQAVTR